MSRYDDRSSRGRPNRQRDYVSGPAAPDYPPSEAMGGYSGEVPRMPSPGRTTYPRPTSQARSAYGPKESFYPPLPPDASNLQIAKSRSQSRPRSLPPPVEYHPPPSSRELTRERWRRARAGDDSDDDDDRSDVETPRTPLTPLAKARGIIGDTFTDSAGGVGVSILGALVGGIAAKEASDATSRHNSRRRRGDPEHRRNQILSTAVGAVVGALGANAFEKRLEDNRERERAARKQDRGVAWRSDGRDSCVLDKTEVFTRPRSGGGREGSRSRSRSRSRGGGVGGAAGWKNDWDPWDHRSERRGSGRGLEREVDTGARSWKDVEDWVCGDRNSERSRLSLDEYRY
ncbi:hypothetical protein DL764_010954 [Monosporascus ibericus]|uniref:Glycine zipper 2TM domain-containing protein n=1 Tax=Monosporascus ibericus TaxID=155417 RepID=A0A4Q4SRS4_9PEZI|nr:hypothetical protein DL764_010954 [Monosporascus ibericus]